MFPIQAVPYWYTILKLLCSLFQECLPAICLSFSVFHQDHFDAVDNGFFVYRVNKQVQYYE